MWTCLNLLNHTNVNYLELLFLLCTKKCSFKLAPVFQLPVWTMAACFTHSLYKPPPFQVKVQISVLSASPRLVDLCQFSQTIMSDSKCVCSVSCCKIIISSRIVLNYKHVLTVWSVKVNWGKKIVDPKTWLFPAGKESEASPTYFLLNWNRNVPLAYGPEVPSLTPSVFSLQSFS